jgi:hypothetical protein
MRKKVLITNFVPRTYKIIIKLTSEAEIKLQAHHCHLFNLQSAQIPVHFLLCNLYSFTKKKR